MMNRQHEPTTLELYTWHTPNGRKPAILLAELEVDYRVHLINIADGEQKRPSYLAINPNGKIPALVDRDPNLGSVTVFESGAILLYLAEKHQRFLPRGIGGRRSEVLSWLFWSIGGPGPAFGQLGQLGREEPRDEHAFAHFMKEAKRLASVIDAQLVLRDHLCDEYSIADIVSYPWFAALAEAYPSALEDTKHVKAWLDRVGSRPAVRAGMKLEPQPRGDEDVAPARAS